MGVETLSPYVLNARVLDWRAYFGLGVLGFLASVDKSSLFSLDREPLILLVELLVSLVFYLTFAFSINNCFDTAEDSLDPVKLLKNPVASGRISFRGGLTFSLVTGVVGILLCILWFNTISVYLYTVSMILAALYSSPPLRFKSRPFFDIASHGLFAGILLFLYGASTLGVFNLNLLFFGTPIFIYSVTLELRNHLEDFEDDREAKVTTTVQKIGPSATRHLLAYLLILHWLLLTILFLILQPSSASLLSAIMMIVTMLVRAGGLFRAHDVVASICYIVMALQV